jgi:hypothetical protein
VAALDKDYYDTIGDAIGMLQALADDEHSESSRSAYLDMIGFIADGIMDMGAEARKAVFDAAKLKRAVKRGHSILHPTAKG